jgi:rfaE bifunctional protein kinase chain/domain
MKIFDRMPPDRLEMIIAAFPRLRLAVVGDYFLDKYLDIDPDLAETSVETGRTAHQAVAVRHSPGAAGTVVCNLAALGAGAISAIGLSGDDGEAYELRRDLKAVRCDTRHLHEDRERMTPTYLKPRDRCDASLAGEHARYDTKNRAPTSVATQDRIVQSLRAVVPQVDAVIVADQVEEPECGAITFRVREATAEAAERYPRVVFWADSRRRIMDFRRVIIKPNQFEAVGRENPRPRDTVSLAEIEAAIARLRAASGMPVCVTRGAAGMIVGEDDLVIVPGVNVAGPVDPTGAGDGATAGAVLALAAGATLSEAALVGNLVASIVVEHLGTTGTARPEQLPPRLALWQGQRGKHQPDT